jgi:hypothetical protein
MPHLDGLAGTYPVACKTTPVFQDATIEVKNLPIQMNFARVVLDMDKQEDEEEYNRIMTYAKADYGMQIIYLYRQFIKKVCCKDGKKRCRTIQRIFIEYYAPYRVLPQS